MRSLIIVALVLTVPLYAGDRRHPVAVSTLEGLHVSFENVAPSGDLELSTADRHRIAGGTVERKAFGVRVDAPVRQSGGSAALLAYVEMKDPRCVVRIDGHELGLTPRLIDAHAAYGSTARHTLEVEVMDTALEGPYTFSIGWEAVRN